MNVRQHHRRRDERVSEPQPDVAEVEVAPYADVLAGNVESVLDYLREHPEETTAIIAAEVAGKGRKTILALSTEE